MSKRIVVVGSFVLDMVAEADEFPLPGQSVIGRSISFYPGGKGINQCVAATRLGAETEMVGMLGNDANGKLFLDIMKKEGIRHDFVFSTSKQATSVAQIQLNLKGENKIMFIPAANFEFSTEHLSKAEESIASAGLVLTQFELMPSITKQVVEICSRFNVPLILNPAPAYKMDARYLAMADYLTPNETELELLSGMSVSSVLDAERASRKLVDAGTRNVIATLGKNGALIVNRDGVRHIAGFNVTPIDTVAAGDSFNGALAKCLLDGMNLDDAVRFANAVGAITVTARGAIPSLPTLERVNEFLIGLELPASLTNLS